MIEKSENTRIRPAVSADASAIAEIYTESILAHDSTMVLDAVDAAQMREKLGSLGKHECILVSESNGYVTGWGIVKLYSDRPGYRKACETSLFLRRSLLGRGIGSLLQKGLMQSARDAGFHHVIVRIWAVNASSIAMHRKFGFEMVGVQKEIGYIENQWIDVAVMQCLLS